MGEAKHTALILMAGPKFDLEWEFGARLEGLSHFSEGYLIVSSSSARSLEIGNFRVISTPFKPDRFLYGLYARFVYLRQCIRTLRQARRSGKPVRLVITYDPLMTGTIGWLLSAMFHADLVCEVNGEYTADANFMHVEARPVRAFKRWAAGVVTRFVLRRAAGIRTLFAEQLEGIGYAPRADQVVMQIPEFVNTSAFRNLGEEPTVLLVGFPYYVKGVDVAIAAFKQIASRFPDWRLEIIGHYPDPTQLIAAIGDCARISHRPAVLHREMNGHIGRCGIVLQSSRTEAMGRVLIEAMAAAKPRVASSVGGIPTVVRDGVDGILVESEDVDGFARALSALMVSEELRRELGNAGAERARTEFTPDRYFGNVATLLARVADQKSARARHTA